ncbi:MAG TPA: methyltransferase domain-containing protein [Acidimicrobiales bacterium]|nr:methyltransferase domain-containing protein [Acidimicrobiales bacterium]
MAEDAPVNEWESVAEAWEANRQRVFDFFRATSDWLVEAIDPRPGQVVLEVAAGPGETGFLVAEAVGPTGRVISSDLAPTMVAAARRGAEARGLANVDCRMMDAQALDLEDDSVDAAISRLGLMLVPDPASAFRELRRVVRPGGTVAYAVIGAPDQNHWMATMIGALMQNGHQPGTGNPFELGGPFGLAAPDVNAEMLRAAGFDDVRTEQISGVMTVADAEDYWATQSSLAGPVKATVERLTDDERAAVQATLADMIAPFETPDGFALPSQLVAVRAS